MYIRARKVPKAGGRCTCYGCIIVYIAPLKQYPFSYVGQLVCNIAYVFYGVHLVVVLCTSPQTTNSSEAADGNKILCTGVSEIIA